MASQSKQKGSLGMRLYPTARILLQTGTAIKALKIGIRNGSYSAVALF